MSLLTPGAQARIYERGMLRGAVMVPHGRMELRNLAPGEYEARCEGADGEVVSVTFLVSAFEEVAIVQIPEGSDAGPVESAETPQRLGSPAGGVPQPDPIYPGTGVTEQTGVLVAALDLTAGGEPAAPGRSTDGPVAPVDPLDPEPYIAELDEATVAQLRHECKRVGVPQKGSKADLVERLRAHREGLGA